MARTILIVDGAESFLLYLELLLTRLGYVVRKSKSATAALDFVRAEKPHAVITEVRLQDLDGIHFCRALRDDPDTARVPVVFLTTDGRKETEEKARASGCTTFLTKPVNIRKLYQALEDLESRRRRHIRMLVALKVAIREGERTLPVETTTFGEGGMFVKTGERYRVGTTLDFVIGVDPTPLSIRGEVVHVADPGGGEPGIGVKFIDVTPDVRSLLSALIERSLVQGSDSPP